MIQVEAAKSGKKVKLWDVSIQISNLRAVRFLSTSRFWSAGAGKNDDFGMSPPPKLRRSKTVEQTYQKKTQAPETCILDVALMSKDVTMALKFCTNAFEITGWLYLQDALLVLGQIPWAGRTYPLAARHICWVRWAPGLELCQLWNLLRVLMHALCFWSGWVFMGVEWEEGMFALWCACVVFHNVARRCRVRWSTRASATCLLSTKSLTRSLWMLRTISNEIRKWRCCLLVLYCRWNSNVLAARVSGIWSWILSQ